ncbi:TetR family transcriptional regulator [Patulibacter brassicae]|uniref:TetR family transcriptional regulator n=2 Tax=Patulibacter brassicae TaxID=1705717 RepID=A0ABU4VNC6_9ACTN|nr:TetR family transcriptional regulator [Patulibacter brassicae]MDX8152569.1 TetR family transcriptional regulator [Patulibacter brassicae]
MAPSTTPLTVLPTVAGPSLPMAGAEQERADAARNRRRLLDAAAALVAERGADAVTMEAVAAAAGVGKGTVFRRFGDRAGLMTALLNHTEIELQEAFLYGDAPLGPGADPVERLIAFGCARLKMVELHGEVLRAAAHGTARFSAPARAVHLTHVATLLRAARVDGDVPLLADTLLASLDAALVLHQQQVLGYEPDRLHHGWADLVRRVTRTCGD